ncbi:hypothetical protein [Stenotrophomonas sp.]|uniref:hypothetical protein n=1 Tax=Stenotrophomonas sp. TaxID=69392 RepID=UPI0028A61A0A|nr:hypothetical protein [Stenotrophomonas sp.]
MSLYPTIYRSTDPGAPAISGQAGALAALLDALLVDGYGAGLNAKAGLGWTREYQSPNLRVYRNNPVTGSGYRVRLDDSAAQYGWMRGYESMSDIHTGINPLPTVAQRANGSMWIKSDGANGVARAWFAIGTERCLYLFIQHTNQGANYSVAYFVGDIRSYVPNDQHCFALSQNGQTTYLSGFGSSITFQPAQSTWDFEPSQTNSPLYIGRNANGTAGAVLVGVAQVANVGVSCPYGGSVANSYYDFPPPVNAGVISVPGMLLERKYMMRGEYPGLRVPFSTNALGDEASMDGVLIAKRFRGTNGIGSNQQLLGEVLFELDREWL